ncbi:DUF2267 domain-containing protein [Streptomyces sp. NBC_00448]|uniref:DUF2267 domain-containing protein n=1 Tax=Streptomyces sp. NBC_00448 TaxID=2903652 RepID=UPI002E206BAE
MHAQPGSRQTAPALPCDYERLLEHVRYDGAYATRERAERAVRTVLTALGSQVGDDLRGELATHLPTEAVGALLAEPSTSARRTGWAFVQDVAARIGVSPAVARWETGAVLSTLATLLPPDLLTRALEQLPPGYALLFGRAELIQAA